MSLAKCVFFQKPLLEAGTLGTKANSEIVIPGFTKSYAQHEKTDDDNAIPMCTLRNFPHLIDHCIEWARAQFTELFEDPPKNVNSFLQVSIHIHTSSPPWLTHFLSPPLG